MFSRFQEKSKSIRLTLTLTRVIIKENIKYEHFSIRQWLNYGLNKLTLDKH
jgi:hypothetical protein